MKKLLLFASLLLTVLMTGCRKEGVEPDIEQGSLHLSIGTKSGLQVQMKGEAREGLSFHNLLVVLTNEGGYVIDKVYKEYPYTPGDTDPQKATGANPEIDDIYFLNLDVGSYHAYAYANIDETAWQQASPNTIAEVEKVIRTQKEDHEDILLPTDRELATLSDADVPGTGVWTDHVLAKAVPSPSMLLTGHAVVPVGVSASSSSIELVRPVVRFNVYVDNNTPFPLQVNALSFSQFNASRTFLIDHRDDSGLPTFPSTNDYRSLPAFTGDPGRTDNCVQIPAHDPDAPASTDDYGDKTLVYSVLLYENRAARYTLHATFTLLNPALSPYPQRELGGTDYTLGDLITPAQIDAMAPGESKMVMMLNPQVASGNPANPTLTNGNVFGSNGITTTNEKVYCHDAGVTRTALEAILAGNKGPYYFLRLVKLADGYLQLFRGDYNLFANIYNGNKLFPVDKLRYEVLDNWDGTRATDMKRICQDFSSFTVRLYTEEQSPASGSAWMLKNSQSKLEINQRSKSKSQTRDVLWVFYSLNPIPSGVQMNVMDEGNHARPLTYMRRNQEINALINVYYEEFSTKFNFRVDNSYWYGDGAHEMEHTFN